MRNEEDVLRTLASTYGQALNDINTAIAADYQAIQELTDRIESLDPSDPQVPILESRRRSKAYQKAYQENLRGQVSGILDDMQQRQFSTVAGYLQACYTDGFVGSMYDMQGQGVPLVIPIDPRAVVQAVQLDSKISEGLYTRLGKDVGQLKKKIAAERKTIIR